MMRVVPILSANRAKLYFIYNRGETLAPPPCLFILHVLITIALITYLL